VNTNTLVKPKFIVKSVKKERTRFTVYPLIDQYNDTINGDMDSYAELTKYANEYPDKEEEDVVCETGYEMYFDRAYEDACVEEQRWDDLKEVWCANQNCL